jgi:hypothetical protein
MRSAWLRASLAPVLLWGACAAAPEPRVVTVPEEPMRPVQWVHGIFSYEQALATLTGMLEQQLGVRRFPVALEFYDGAASLEGALVKSGYDREFARATAGAMMAIGGYRRVLLNGSALSNLEWPDRVGLLAHELTHSLQYELGGGRRGASDQWLREGFAEWVSMDALQRLRATTIHDARRQSRDRLRRTKRNVPRLAQMVTFREWVELSAPRDGVPYAHAFLATDFLIGRHGIAALLRYFSLFAHSEDRAANFRTAFGEDLAAFEAALAANGSGLTSQRR